MHKSTLYLNKVVFFFKYMICVTVTYIFYQYTIIFVIYYKSKIDIT